MTILTIFEKKNKFYFDSPCTTVVNYLRVIQSHVPVTIVVRFTAGVNGINRWFPISAFTAPVAILSQLHILPEGTLFP